MTRAVLSTLGASLVSEQKLATGLPTLLPNLSIVVNGVTMTCTQVVSQADEHIAAEQHILSLKAQLRVAQANVKPMRVAMRATSLQVKAAAAVAFGNTSESYETLGFTPVKPRKVTTVAERAVGIEKSLATRELRGTKGSRQKAAIHGAVPTASSAPTPAPATPPVAATPATVK
jgi:hypothetical protein